MSTDIKIIQFLLVFYQYIVVSSKNSKNHTQNNKILGIFFIIWQHIHNKRTDRQEIERINASIFINSFAIQNHHHHHWNDIDGLIYPHVLHTHIQSHIFMWTWYKISKIKKISFILKLDLECSRYNNYVRAYFQKLKINQLQQVWMECDIVIKIRKHSQKGFSFYASIRKTDQKEKRKQIPA